MSCSGQISISKDETAQRDIWDNMEVSFDRLLTEVTIEKIEKTADELKNFDLYRGRGLFCRTIVSKQRLNPQLTNILAALVTLINDEFDFIGGLLLKRLTTIFLKSYEAMDQTTCHTISNFLAHLFNQGLVLEEKAMIFSLDLLAHVFENEHCFSMFIATEFITACNEFFRMGINESISCLLANINLTNLTKESKSHLTLALETLRGNGCFEQPAEPLSALILLKTRCPHSISLTIFSECQLDLGLDQFHFVKDSLDTSINLLSSTDSTIPAKDFVSSKLDLAMNCEKTDNSLKRVVKKYDSMKFSNLLKSNNFFRGTSTENCDNISKSGRGFSFEIAKIKQTRNVEISTNGPQRTISKDTIKSILAETYTEGPQIAYKRLIRLKMGFEEPESFWNIILLHCEKSTDIEFYIDLVSRLIKFYDEHHLNNAIKHYYFNLRYRRGINSKNVAYLYFQTLLKANFQSSWNMLKIIRIYRTFMEYESTKMFVITLLKELVAWKNSPTKSKSNELFEKFLEAFIPKEKSDRKYALGFLKDNGFDQLLQRISPRST